MRKIFLMAIAVALTMTACEKPVMDESDAEQVESVNEPTKKFTFTLKGDFSPEWKLDASGDLPTGDAGNAAARGLTRGYLQADGKDLTDVWILDYMDGELVQQIHQSDNTAEDFGNPQMQLAYGSHHVYFIAGRGTGAVLDTENHTITFAKSLDTFYKDYEVTVVSTSNGNRAVTLNRVVTRLRLTFTDAVDANAATINITPHTWYYAWDYVNGVPTGAATDQVVTLTIPDSEKGKAGLQASLFGFSTATEWATDIAFNSKNSEGDVLGQATITAAPFIANRSTEYSGPLFGSEGSMTLSLNTTWDDAVIGTW